MIPTVNMDAELENADWMKTTWDLPPYKSADFFLVVHDLESFRKLPVYENAVASGLIFDDEWVGDYVNGMDEQPAEKSVRSYLLRKFNEDQERDENGRWTSGGGDAGASRDTEGVWRDAKGQPLDAATQARIAELKVPPQWKDVKLNPDPKGALQAVGRDSKGRQVYLYSAEHAASKSAEKFERLKAFDQALPNIRQRMAADRQSTTEGTREAALALTLIDRTGFRPGSDSETGAKVKAYGATTLRAEHVQINGDTLEFKFIGKKGVEITKTLKDPELAQALAPRVAAGGRLFNTSDAAVRNYLKSTGGNDFKVKDFRTWNGTATALREVSTRPIPSNAKEFDKAQREVSKIVSQHLGNTPAVAKASYIDPAVWSRWEAAALKKQDAGLEELMKDYFETVAYTDAPPWRDAPELGTSEDEPE